MLLQTASISHLSPRRNTPTPLIAAPSLIISCQQVHVAASLPFSCSPAESRISVGLFKELSRHRGAPSAFDLALQVPALLMQLQANQTRTCAQLRLAAKSGDVPASSWASLTFSLAAQDTMFLRRLARFGSYKSAATHSHQQGARPGQHTHTHTTHRHTQAADEKATSLELISFLASGVKEL